MTTIRAALISVLEEFDPAGDYNDPRIDSWIDRIVTAVDDHDALADRACDSEMNTWDYYRPEQIDQYWMRCDILGPHTEHENSETGAHWK